MWNRFALILLAASLVSPGIAQADDRAADRAAIRAHIDRVFQAFIHKDRAELRATHAQNWLGYLESSRKMISGIDAMAWFGSVTTWFGRKIEVVNRSGAVSPAARAIARVAPVSTPPSTVGITTNSTVRHLLTPSA